MPGLRLPRGPAVVSGGVACKSLRQRCQPVLADFFDLYRDRGQAAVLEGAAVEQEPDAAGVVRPGTPEVHALAEAVRARWQE